jgi:hypothetical protein
MSATFFLVFFHTKTDKGTISAWRQELDRILHVFNVRFIPLSPPLLIIRFHFQTEIAINTHAAVSDVRQDISNTRNIASDVLVGVANTHAIVSGVRYDIANTHNIASDVQQSVASTRNMVSGTHNIVFDTHNVTLDIRRAILSGKEPRNTPGIFAYFL